MLKSAILLHKYGLGDSDINSTALLSRGWTFINLSFFTFIGIRISFGISLKINLVFFEDQNCEKLKFL